MVVKHELFDTSKLNVRPFSERKSLVSIDDTLIPGKHEYNQAIAADNVADRLREIRGGNERFITSAGRRVVLFMGAHLIKHGLSRYIIELMQNGWITSIATTGAGLIHDWELTHYGQTSESVEENLKDGSFGNWSSMVHLNSVINHAGLTELALGASIGKELATIHSPSHIENSIFAQAYLAQVPITVHPTIGADIAHQASNFNGANWGSMAQVDFLIFVEQVRQLQRGAYISLGSSVTSPEVLLKALSMSRNVQKGKPDSFTTAVFDLNTRSGTAWKEPKYKGNPRDPEYYWRPGKTLLHRVVPGGEGLFVPGDLRDTLPSLHGRLVGG